MAEKLSEYNEKLSQSLNSTLFENSIFVSQNQVTIQKIIKR